MIAIVNVQMDKSNPMGWAEYELRINQEVIARFRHERRDGLGKCLMEAAKAAEKAKWAKVEQFMDLMNQK